MKKFARPFILAAQVTAPKQLPHTMSPQNHPYSGHTRRRPSSSILHHRYSILPPATAHTQYAAICAATRYTQTRQPATQTCAGQAPSGSSGGRLTVTPQLAYKALSTVGRGLALAFLQASDQKVSEDMRMQGGRKRKNGQDVCCCCWGNTRMTR